jgi:four helix bundle protein
MPEERKYDLEDRTIQFGSKLIRFVDRMPSTIAGKHLAGQLLRSGTAPALHYGEAQSAESRRDFIHKMKVALKELRESRANMRMIELSGMMPMDSDQRELFNECNELILILSRSVRTVEENDQRIKRP